MQSSFGLKKKKFIQEANRRSVLKGTVGMFGKWCRSQGLAKDGKVTLRCINKAKSSGNTTLIRRATFAKNIGGYAGAVHRRRSRFGNWENQEAFAVLENKFNDFINSKKINSLYIYTLTSIFELVKSPSGDIIVYSNDESVDKDIYTFNDLKKIIKNVLIYEIWISSKKYPRGKTIWKNKKIIGRHALNTDIEKQAKILINKRIQRENVNDELKEWNKKSGGTGTFAGEDCAICLESLKNGRFVSHLNCGHSFHRKCMGDVNQCPMCRAEIQFGKRNVKKQSKKSNKKPNKKPNKKYTPGGGRKSPGVSATKFPVGTVKTGLDGKSWIIKKVSNGTKRWVRMKSQFGKRSIRSKRSILSKRSIRSIQNNVIYKADTVLEKANKEIITAEKIVEEYPYNDSLKSRVVYLIKKAKEKVQKLFSTENISNVNKYIMGVGDLVSTLARLFSSLILLTNTFTHLEHVNSTVAKISKTVVHLFKIFTRQHTSTEANWVNIDVIGYPLQKHFATRYYSRL